MTRYYRIGRALVPATLFTGKDVLVSRDITTVLVDGIICRCDTEERAARAFDRITAILGAEDLCAGEEAEKVSLGNAVNLVGGGEDVE